MSAAMDLRDPSPAGPIRTALVEATFDLLWAEDFAPMTPAWRAIEGDMSIAIEFREMIERRRRWAVNFDHQFGIVKRQLLAAYGSFMRQLPEACLGDWPDEGERGLEVPLIELIDDPAGLVEDFVRVRYNPEAEEAELFLELRSFFQRNYLVASGYAPDDDRPDRSYKMIAPKDQKDRSAAAIADLYLAGTPFRPLLDLPVPFDVPDEVRFEHCHIVGGTGHGKTQLMQRMIHADLVAAQRDLRSVIVIDSQGDLINKLRRLALFDPAAPGILADRLVIIDPADVEFPAALNLFDAPLDRIAGYRAVDRERVLNGVIELYETFFGSMLGAELTQKQGVIFRYLARLMVTIPAATIHTLMQLMEDGKPFKRFMDQLDGSARYFFQTEFFHPSFAATKKQILRRLWGVLSTPAFERMFAQKSNKLDLFEAMNEGKIVLVSTAKDLLKEDGSALFGRFFIAMLKQAALERSVLAPEDRTPAFVYIDEAQEYFDDSIETILNQARKYNVGLTLAHQTLDQLSPRLRSAILTNTSFKCAGGVSAKDARGLADELRTTPDFIESMKRRGERSEFAAWLKHSTPRAIRLTVPLGFLERQPLLTEEAFDAVMEQNRARYCGTLADVVGFDFAPEPKSEPPAQKEQPRPPEEPPVEPAGGRAPSRSEPRSPTFEPQVLPEPEEEPLAPVIHRVERAEPRELGKGGSQHRYVQHLIKGLGEDRGFRAVIEESVEEGGQIDVALHRDRLSIACEISVTSKPEYEAQNLAKCLRGGFSRVFAVAADSKRLRAIEAQARGRLSADDMARILFLTPELVADALDALAPPAVEGPTLVRGYRVKVSRTTVGAAEAQDRRAAVARVIAQSMRGLPKDE
ncbi:MAG TPA: DUF87 domain-containing protein [Polyangia bacterium]|nr:DUF87 domain-containing protein [Polyangia bacterium]